jgi:hypothetical protein
MVTRRPGSITSPLVLLALLLAGAVATPAVSGARRSSGPWGPSA